VAPPWGTTNVIELPGWNSIHTTGTLANVFFWVSIGALAFVGIAQIISQRYAEQRDLLVNQQHAAEQRTSDEEIGRLRRQAGALSANLERSNVATAGANTRAQEAQQALEQLKAPRTLTPDATRAIKVALKPFAGQQWTMTTFWDLKEPVDFATLLYEPLNNAGWRYDNSGTKSLLLDGLAGVQVFVHPQADIKVKAAAAALVAVLNKYDFNAALKLMSALDNSDKIQINIGTKTDPSGLGTPP
jgi:hypothetical protein